MGKHLVLVGGGHAHLATLLELDRFVRRGHRVTLVSPSPWHYYSGMGPGLLAGRYQPAETRFCVSQLAEERGGTFIQDHAALVNPCQRIIRLASGAELSYDIASFNIGSEVPLASDLPAVETIVPVKPISGLAEAGQYLLREAAGRQLQLVVLGGGPAGVEIAGNLQALLADQPQPASITLVAGEALLPAAPARVGQLARASLEARGIRILTGVRGEARPAGRVLLSDGTNLAADVTFVAVGVRPPTLFAASGLPVGTDGGLLVNDCLQSTAWPELFAGGDCLSLSSAPLAKVGVYAVRQGAVLRQNLLAALEGRPLKRFTAGGAYLLILNLGDGTGIAWKRSLVWHGRLALQLKEFIDRRFMARYQG